MKKIVLLSVLFLLSVTGARAQNIIYVNAAATGAGNGTSWANAFTDFQTGVNTAAPGDHVFVAGGTYLAPSGGSFSMKQGVKIYGGFAGTETNPAQRDLAAGHVSILKGNGNTVIYNFNNGLDASAVLDGFTITGGVGRTAGGIFNYATSPTISNVIITQNKSTSTGGGGMQNYVRASPVLTNVIFTGNSAQAGYGGGMYNYSSSPTITNCLFQNNIAGLGGGGMYNISASPMITNSLFQNNIASSGGGMFNNSSSSPTITNSLFQSNRANGNGGGIYNNGLSLTITNSLFQNNSANIGAGGIYNISGDGVFTNVTLVNNGALGFFSSGFTYWNNSIIWDNIDGGGYTFSYCLIKGSNNTDNGNTDATGLSSEDIFMDPANGDLSLKNTGPAINAGSNSLYEAADRNTGNNSLQSDVDLAANLRLFGNSVDMGAYEYQGTPITPDAGNILYVDQSVSGGNGSGDSWANAIPELADALKWARQQHDADGNWLQNDSLRIFIAKGTYKPLYNAADGSYTTDGGRDNAFVMVNNVQLYGGYPAGGGTRNWSTNRTILSGDIGTAGDSADNTYHVVISAGDVGNAGLNGVTISGGNADGSNSVSVNGNLLLGLIGGGIYNYTSSPRILNSIISNNAASNCNLPLISYIQN